MGNKKLTNLFCVLFIITFALGVVGYLNKDKGNNNPTPNTPVINNDVVTLDFNNVELEVSGFEDRVKGYDFVKANREFNSGYLNVSLDGEVVKVSVQKEGINSGTEEDRDLFEYTIESIKNVSAIQAIMSSSEGNLVKVYILDANNKLYCATFNADPRYYDKVTTTLYNISDVESFAVLSDAVFDAGAQESGYVIFKTADGTYYTDYLFDSEKGLAITKIASDKAAVEVVENPTEQTNAEQETENADTENTPSESTDNTKQTTTNESTDNTKQTTTNETDTQTPSENN